MAGAKLSPQMAVWKRAFLLFFDSILVLEVSMFQDLDHGPFPQKMLRQICWWCFGILGAEARDATQDAVNAA